MKTRRILCGFIPLLLLGACGGSDLSPGSESPPGGDSSGGGGWYYDAGHWPGRPDSGGTTGSNPIVDAGGPRDGSADAGKGDAAPPSDAGRGEPPDPTAATAYLINPAHTGAVVDPLLAPPLRRRWDVSFGDATSYPLIVHGRVYVIVGSRAPAPGLLAIDAHTGRALWGPIDLGQSEFNAPFLAYDDGRIFTVNGSGLVQAFDAATGRPIWASQLPYQYVFSSPLTAYRGIVYTGGAGGGGTVYAVRESDGALLWTQFVENGDDSSPAVSDDGVYVSYACIQAYEFDRVTGSPIWHHAGPCEGGGGDTPILYSGKLYARDWGSSNLILDATSGTALGSFTASAPPAFDQGFGFFVSGGNMHATIAATENSAWSFTGDHALSTAPVVAGGHVYVGSTHPTLFALDERSGKQVWSDDLSDTGTIGTMAAAEGILVVPSGQHLVAYEHHTP